jgi:cobalt/nickel transport system ATP-binding protein
VSELIRLEDVRFAYRADQPVLRCVNLTVHEGERIAIDGANGSGKSTLLHIMVGLRAPEEGVVRIFGAPRRTKKDFIEVRRRIGLVFQNSDDQLFCPTVLEDVAFGPLNQGFPLHEARTRALDTLKSLDLDHLAERPVYHLSGGEKRLVAVATVLSMRPDVLLLDEPMAGLDESSRTRMLTLLRDVTQTMVLVSHDPEVRNACAQRTVALIDGATSRHDVV